MATIELGLPVPEVITKAVAKETVIGTSDPDPSGTYLDYLQSLCKAEQVVYAATRYRRAQVVQRITFGRRPNRLEMPNSAQLSAARELVNNHWHRRGIPPRPADYPNFARSKA